MIHLEHAPHRRRPRAAGSRLSGVCIYQAPRSRDPAGRGASHARGSVLIITMGVLMVLAGMTLVFARSMRVEAMSSANHAAQLQADQVARGAIAYLRTALANTEGQFPSDGDILAEAVPVGDGYFWLLRHDPTSDTTAAFGITDETGKININSADAATLTKLLVTNLNTDDVSGAIVDWRDADEEVSSSGGGGAESSYYLSLPESYNAKNSPFETVEELLLVNGVTPQVLFGEDRNRNGLLDPNEDDGDVSDPPDNRNGKLDRGLIDCVTVYSVDPDREAQGDARIDVNVAPTSQLATVLATAVAPARLGPVMVSAVTKRPFANLIDFYYKAGLTLDEFRKVENRLTAQAVSPAPGTGTVVVRTNNRPVPVNINTAPEPVLAALPGLDVGDAAALITRRGGQVGTMTSLADVIEALPRDKAIAVGNSFTFKSYRCSAQIVAVDGAGRAFKRYQVVFDTQTSPVTVLYFRDLTSLGWPLDPQILATLRAGEKL